MSASKIIDNKMSASESDSNVLINNEKLSLSSDNNSLSNFGFKIVKKELFDIDALEMLYSHPNLGEKDRKKLKAYFKKRENVNMVEVKYDYPPKYKQSGYARVFAEKGLGLQQFSREIRNLLAKKYYFDIDMVNCHPTILLKICKDNNWACPNLERYVTERDTIIAELGEKYDINKSDIKVCMNTLMYLGDLPYNSKISEDEFLNAYKTEMFAIANNIKIAYPKIYLDTSKNNKERVTDKQKLSTCLSFVLTTEEHKILMAINRFLESNNRNVDVLMYDGCLVRKLPDETEFDMRLLIETEKAILDDTGHNVKLAVKPLESSIVFTKTKEQIEAEERRKQMEEEYKTNNYKACKETFELLNFKVNDPVCYCEIIDGNVKIRSREKFIQRYENKKYIGKINGEFCELSFIEEWLKDSKIRTYKKLDIYPPPLECPPDEFNLWTGFAIERSFAPSSGNVEPFLNHMKILNNYDEKAVDFFVKWLAHIFQRPAELEGVAPVFIGEQGAGKSIVFDVVLALLMGGDKYFGTCKPTQDLFSRFSNGRYCRILINIDETKAKESCANSEEMKNAITAKTYNHEVKGQDPITVRNFNRFGFTTNQVNPVKVEETDRRYWIVNTSSDKLGDSKYFDDMIEYCENECNMKAIYEYLMSIDVSNVKWSRDRPLTDTYNDIKTLYVDNVYKFLINIILTSTAKGYSFKAQDLYDAFIKWCENNKCGGKLNSNGDFEVVYTNTMFGMRLNNIMTVDKNSGIEKVKRSVNYYELDIDKLKAFFTKRKLLDCDYSFNHTEFLGKWRGEFELY